MENRITVSELMCYESIKNSHVSSLLIPVTRATILSKRHLAACDDPGAIAAMTSQQAQPPVSTMIPNRNYFSDTFTSLIATPTLPPSLPPSFPSSPSHHITSPHITSHHITSPHRISLIHLPIKTQPLVMGKPG